MPVVSDSCLLLKNWECDKVENVGTANPDRFQFKSTHLLPSHSLAGDSVSPVASLPSGLIHTTIQEGLYWLILTNQCSTTSIWCLFNLWIRLPCSSVFSLFILWAIYNHCPLYIQRGRPFLVHSSSQLSTCELFYILCLQVAFPHNGSWQGSFPLLRVRSCPEKMTRVKGQCH